MDNEVNGSSSPGRCDKCGAPAIIHLCEIKNGVKSERHLCAEHGESTFSSLAAGKMESNIDPHDADAMRKMMGPGHLDHSIRSAIQYCWMMLPSDKRTVDEIEAQVRRVVERALKDLRDDSAAFGLPPNK